MSKILIDRTVLEQALWTLEDVFGKHKVDVGAINALRAALEQPQDHFPNAGNRVPTGWKLVPVEPTKDMKAAGAFAAMDQVRRSYNPPSAYIPVDSMALLSYRAMIAAAPQPPTTEQSSAVQPQVEQEPLAVVTGFYGGFPTIRPLEPATALPAGMALYANPQQPRQPLTDDEIEKLFPYTREWLYEIGLEEATKFARAIERAHGIGGEK